MGGFRAHFWVVSVLGGARLLMTFAKVVGRVSRRAGYLHAKMILSTNHKKFHPLTSLDVKTHANFDIFK